MLSLVKSKKGVSVVIGYVILVSFVIVLGIIVYSWMKTYVPSEEINCPDGVSIFVKSYKCSSGELTLYLKNNGKFNIGGYFIYATTSPGQEIATLDISRNIIDNSSKLYPTGIRLGSLMEIENSLSPNEEEADKYDISGIEAIYSIEILPIRWQEENNKRRLVSCKNAKIKESILCLGTCISESAEETCSGIECGIRINNCLEEVDCGDCIGEELCNSTGQCVPPEECTDNCSSLGYECGEVCGDYCGECSLENAISNCVDHLCVILECDEGWDDCNGIASDGCEAELGINPNCEFCGNDCTPNNCVNGICSSCNGTWVAPETSNVECDGTPLPDYCLINCTCEGGYVSDGFGGCTIPGYVVSCPTYCEWLPEYTNGACRQNEAQCTSFCTGGVLEPGGDLLGDCQTPTNKCCCCP